MTRRTPRDTRSRLAEIRARREDPRRRYWLVEIGSWDDTARGSFRLRLDAGFVSHDRGRLVVDREGRGQPDDVEEVREGARLALGYRAADGRPCYALLIVAKGARWHAVGAAAELVFEDVELVAGPFDTWSAFEAAARQDGPRGAEAAREAGPPS